MTERIDTVGAEGAILHGLAAVGAGVANNALIQMLGTLPPLQIALLRAFGTIAILGPIWFSQRPRVPSRLAILRAGLEAAGTLLLVMALSRATLSFVATIMMTIPIGVMAVGAFLIGDPVSRRGRGLIFVCFAAAAAATTPSVSSEISGAVFAVVSAMCYVARDVLTKKYPTASSSVEMSLMASLVTLIGALLFGGLVRWHPIATQQYTTISAMVIFYLASNLLIVSATRRGPSVLVAATRYSAILWAILFDYVFFGRPPAASSAAAGLVIILGGIGLTLTERRRAGR